MDMAGNVHWQPGEPAVSWAAGKAGGQQGEGGGSAPLLCSCQTPPGVLQPCQGSPAQHGAGPVGVGPGEGHEGGQRAGASLL